MAQIPGAAYDTRPAKLLQQHTARISLLKTAIFDKIHALFLPKDNLMEHNNLNILEKPTFKSPRMLLGFSGWMDGGEVSTGTVEGLVESLNARKFASIDHEGFYIYNFPGSMELAALFRPHSKIENARIENLEFPANYFFACEKNDLILFLGKEPNLHWRRFAECIFTLCNEFSVKMIYFIGSVAGLVPHTREPRILCSLSDPGLMETFHGYGVKFANYEGPASFVTYLTTTAPAHNLRMASLVATIPAYVQGNNPKAIEAVTRRLASMLGLHVELDRLRSVSDEFERKLSELIQDQPELAETISKLEESYDDELFESEMADLKHWLQQKGVRVD